MSLPTWTNELVTVILIVGLIYALALIGRRIWLGVQGGLFDCALRRSGAARFRPGLARYAGETLEWYLVWHPWPRPTKVFEREDSKLGALRESDASESSLGYAFSTILTLQVTGEVEESWELALNEGSAMGLVSWLESAPPGRQLGYRRRLDG